MTRLILALGFLGLVALPARADDKQGVRSSHTVEVIDDASQIDDVISRVRKEPDRPGAESAAAAELKRDRPPLPSEIKRAPVTPADKAPAWRRPHAERTERSRKK